MKYKIGDLVICKAYPTTQGYCPETMDKYIGQAGKITRTATFRDKRNPERALHSYLVFGLMWTEESLCPAD